jgi:hypothetical protein
MYIDDFIDSIEIWIAALQQYDFKELLAKPGPASWSIGQVYTHLIGETRYYMEQVECCLDKNENASEEMTANAKMMFEKNEMPDQRIKGDSFIADNVKQPESKEQLQKEMLELKSRMNILWTRIINSDCAGKAQHPGLGYFSAAEWVRFSDMHLRHHLRQKRRIDDVLK